MQQWLYLPLFCLLPIASVLAACPLDVLELERDRAAQVRSFFSLNDATEIRLVKFIDEITMPRSQRLALLELVSVDRIFEKEKPKSKDCPDSMIKIYRVKTQDEFRICSGIMRLQLPAKIYDVLYLNCGS